MPNVTGVSVGPRLGIMAPRPQALIADNIKRGQKVEIRPGEPVFVFIETKMGTGGRLEGLNKKTPFKISLSRPPAGVPVPRTMGQWFRIELKAGEKAGQTDRIALVTRAVVPGAPVTERKNFTLVSGHQRYY